MTGISLGTGLRAMLSAQSVLDTIGNNIANANTPGYARQRVELSASPGIRMRGLLVGTGVQTDTVARLRDDVIVRRLLSQYGVSGRLESMLQGMSTMESLVSEGDGYGLTSRMGDLFASLSGLAASPGDAVLRTAVGQSASDMTSSFNALSENLSILQEDIPLMLRAMIIDVNTLGEGIAQLNDQIAQSEATGSSANSLRDQRARLLDEMSELVDMKAVDSANGRVTVLVGGNVLVGQNGALQMEFGTTEDGAYEINIDGVSTPIEVSSGKIGGLLDLAEGPLSSFQEKLDQLAHNLIFEFNKVHANGMPISGPFTSLSSSYTFDDQDGDGSVLDERLGGAGLPFDVQDGVLQVNITDLDDGEMTKHQIEIDPVNMTVGDLVDALRAIPGLQAAVDDFGRLHVSSDVGQAFDFSSRLDESPDPIGAFGGDKASLATTSGGPFTLAPGDTLDLFVPGTGVNVNLAFQPGDFVDITAATAEELAAVINADPNAQLAGLSAEVVGGDLVLQTDGGGSAASFDVVGGTALAGLGWGGFAGQSITGSDDAVDVQISGSYTGDVNDLYTFQVIGEGIVGTTPGLRVEVMDGNGFVIATVDVGEGYPPGTEIPIANGVSISLGLGTLSESQGDKFQLDVVADADTSDLLAATGLNAMFTGTSARDIALREDIQDNIDLLATSVTGAEGDNQILLQLLAVEDFSLDSLEERTLGNHYLEMVAELGFEVGATRNSLDANTALTESLEARRDEVSGVNVDEELVEMIKYEQAFGAAVQYITVVNQLTDELMSIL